nr:unnamed protein product [Callosobruchus chinensis]
MLSCLRCNAIFERQITLDEHILRTHPNFIAFVISKIHECTLCAFKTTRSGCFKEHLLEHPEANPNYKFRTCAHCNVAFKKKVSLDNHMLNKHPNFISSVTYKIHKCTECNYRTTMSTHLKRHLLKHTETPTNHILRTCAICPAEFKSKRSLDDHILRNHPNSIASVTYKIHECTLCTFKTTRSGWFQEHLLKHPGTISTCAFCPAGFKSKRSLDQHIVKKHPNYGTSFSCYHCNYIFRSKRRLISHMEVHQNKKNMLSCLPCNRTFERQITLNEHILRTHPNFIAFITSKIHECTLCAFKTTRSDCFKDHLLKHPEATCAHCNVAFKKKVSLDNHMLNKHPNFISSVTHKIHKCTECNYRTTMSNHLKRHLLKHTETPTNHKHCNTTFKTKTLLDNHVIKKHPNSTSSVTNKIHRCTECNYKTTKSTDLKKHSLKHTEIPDTRLLSTCAFCPAGFKSKRSLDQHIVKKHPNSIASVTEKILKCRKCTYKTTISSHLKSHLLNHSKAPA